MKKIYTLFVASVFSFASITQLSAQCTGGRYITQLFPANPILTSDVVYGNNIDYTGASEVLKLDIYEPQCDTATARPLIVFAHGGAFVAGDKAGAGYTEFCIGYAKLGYVVASINYRLGFAQDQYGFNGAIMRGVHDGRAAVRFMRDNALNGGNTWKIDPNMIYFAGASAGGIIALHLAYQDLQSELTMDCTGCLGAEPTSLEGTSNNLTCPSTISAILCISGGIRDLSWIHTNDIPAFLAHGDQDGTVPYGNGLFGGYFPVSGGSTVADRCSQTGTTYCFKRMYGQDHQITNPAYVDTIAVISTQFLDHCTCNAALNCTYNGLPPALVPSVSIAVTSCTNPTCQGVAVTFTATAVNPGPVTPVYQWQVNGVNVGTNSITYSSTTLANADIVTCFMSSICNNPDSATSAAITMVVKPTGAPTISIALTSGTNPDCAGTGVTFTATSTNEGIAPVYQWKVNGSNVGTNSTTYTPTTITNGDIITCGISIPASSTCSNTTAAISNAITITVVNPVTPSVSIAITSGANPTCPGLSVTFTATPVNGGATPVYQWQVNSINVGTNSTTFTTTTLANSDIVSCTMTSNATCANPPTAASSVILITVASPAPSPTIATAITFGANPTCGGLPVTFTATITNGGSTPTYQWKVNGVNVGTNLATYTTTTLASGDIVTCSVTSNTLCVNTPTVASAGITMAINPPVTPSIAVAVTSGSNQICAADTTSASATFTATASNAGTNPVYQWYLNGSQITGAQNPTYTLTALVNNDVITCKVVSSASCASPASVSSTGITIRVTPSPALNFTTNMSVCGGNINASNFSSTPSGATYTWTNSNTAIGLAASGTGNVPAFMAVNSSSASITATITVTPTLNGCAGTPSAYTITVDPTATITQSGNVLTSSTSSTYQWYRDGQPIIGATGQTCTATQNGSYSVVVANNVCPSEVVTIGVSGINPVNNNYFFTIYPNPNDGNFTVSFDISIRATYTLELKNSLGALVYREVLTDFSGSYSKQMDITKYGKGIYLISLTNKQNGTAKKMIVY